MGYNEVKCQVCGKELNENSMFGWVKGDKCKCQYIFV